jgi:hypothetical protein
MCGLFGNQQGALGPSHNCGGKDASRPLCVGLPDQGPRGGRHHSRLLQEFLMNRLLRVAAASGLSLATAAALAACSSGLSVPQASQGAQQQSIGHQVPVAQQVVVPRFEVLHGYQGPPQLHPAGGAMPLWNGSFQYNNNTYHFTMIGANPASSNVTTTIPVAIIPVDIEAGATQFNPNKSKAPNGQTITKNTLNSPIFQSGIDFNQGGTDLGNTQYLDAFQRGNFWSSVSKNTSYHTLLKARGRALQTLTGATTGNPFGNLEVAEIDINTFDSFARREISALKIPAGTFPIFLTYNTYLTESGGCCIGGYHDYDGTNTYAQASYISQPGDFSQDVSALSHEVGEWYDDPLTNNSVACGILEVGDPLEGGSPGHPYGGYSYKLNNFTYNLQDLVWLPYFGAPPSTSANSWSTFQGEKLSVCQNGG